MNLPNARILVVDDEANVRKVLGALLAQQGYEVHAESDGQAALMRFRTAPMGTFDAVVTDLRMPNMTGMELLRALQQHDPALPVVMLTAHGSVDTAVEAVKSGAFDFLEKPFDRDQLDQVLAKAVHTRRHTGPVAMPLSPPPTGLADPGMMVGMVGQSPAITRVREIINTAAASPSTVLITGEPGTGQELVAQALHGGSPRHDRPLIRVNCAAIPPTLIEGELFGHEMGNAPASSRPGRFELADGGTLFLDEISEIPPEVQVKMLRAVHESQFERVGGVRTLSVDTRLIAATHRDLGQEIASGRFREDLFYRLNVVPIVLPPLRERPGDIPELIAYFVALANERLQKQVFGFHTSAIEALCAYPWPGNIRELENLVERMVLFASGPEIHLEDLPELFIKHERTQMGPGELDMGSVGGGARNIRLPLSALGLDLKEAVRAGSRLVEETLIREALSQTDSNVTRSARLLGISRRSLQSKMKELGLRDNSDANPPRG